MLHTTPLYIFSMWLCFVVYIITSSIVLLSTLITKESQINFSQHNLTLSFFQYIIFYTFHSKTTVGCPLGEKSEP